jgi:sulfotransferase
MKKTFHFMAGLPRSGSTVLSALLNQHPDVYSSPQTDLLQLMYEMQIRMPELEAYRAGLFPNGFRAMLENMPVSHYSKINKPVVIDKNRGWGAPYNMTNIAPILNPNGKIILTMRPILEVLASAIKVTEKSNKILNSNTLFDESLFISKYRSRTDVQVENLMQLNGELDMAILSIYNLLENYSDRVIVIWFDELISKPQETMNRIYKFLDIEKFENDFQSINSVDKHDDLLGYGVLGLHDVAKKLHKPDTNPSDYLSDFIIKKYENALDFLIGKFPTNR